MTQRLTARVQFTLTPKDRARLEDEAARRHRDVSKTARSLLIEALSLHEASRTDKPLRLPYEIDLDEPQIKRLKKLGYLIYPIDEAEELLWDFDRRQHA